MLRKDSYKGKWHSVAFLPILHSTTERRGGVWRVARGGCGHGGVLVLIYPKGQYSGIPRLI